LGYYQNDRRHLEIPHSFNSRVPLNGGEAVYGAVGENFKLPINRGKYAFPVYINRSMEEF
jgi:hypothetical protein